MLHIQQWNYVPYTVSGLTEALQGTIQEVVPRLQPSPHSKHWWSTELTVLKEMKNKLSNKSYKYCVLMDHPVHEDHRKTQLDYSVAILKAKKDHWDAFLEDMSYGEVWIANHYVSGEASDGGKTCILMLTLQNSNPSLPPTVASTNKEKSHMLTKPMFPARPDDCVMPETEDNNQLLSPGSIMEEQKIGRAHV